MLNRANHTGAQSIESVAGLQNALNSAATASDLSSHVSATDNPHGVTAAQVGLGNVADGVTVNATDAALRDRATHTGAQAIGTITDLQTTLDGKAATNHVHAIDGVTGLRAALDAKLPTARYNLDLALPGLPVTDAAMAFVPNFETCEIGDGMKVSSPARFGVAGGFNPNQRGRSADIGTGGRSLLFEV